VPPDFAPKAKYAIGSLLLPLGLRPHWVEGLNAESARLYYGPERDARLATAVHLTYDPQSSIYFSRKATYDAEAVRWDSWDKELWPVLFGDERGADYVASSFYWLSGWQEYTSSERDEHGRFPFAASLQAALGTAVRPSVDAYREMLADRLQAAGISIYRRTWGDRTWTFCPTHDIDYLRKWRPGLIYRELVENTLLNHRGVGGMARMARLGGFIRDFIRPGDVYRKAFERLQSETMAAGGTATFFIKTGARDPHDVPYSTRSRYLLRRLNALQTAGFDVGLHPSYLAADRGEYLREEAAILRSLLREVPVSVRQHYLRFEQGTTSHFQKESGFKIDSTLGFAEHEGFRCATCHPFQLFDIEENAPTELWEMPLSVMESILFNRRKYTAEEARDATNNLAKTCRRFGGAMVGLWHNTAWDELDCPGWGQHFMDTLHGAVRAGGNVLSLRKALTRYLATNVEKKG